MEAAPKRLKTFLNSRKLIEIYTQSDETFSVGRVVRVGDTGFAVKSVDEQGRECGYAYFTVQSVRAIEEDTEYLEKLESYGRFWQSRSKDNVCLAEEDVFGEDVPGGLLSGILCRQFFGKHIVLLGYRDRPEADAGYLLKLKERELVLRQVDVSSGCFLDDVTAKLDQIVYVEFGSVDNRLLEYANLELEGGL